MKLGDESVHKERNGSDSSHIDPDTRSGSCDENPGSCDENPGSCDENPGSCNTRSCGDDTPVIGETNVIELFRDDFAAARAKLNGDTEKPVRPARQMFGHRAGSDAFMTGYAFGCYAVMDSCRTDVASGDELCGLREMRNSLASRSATWKVPLQILKSKFVKTSSTHALAKGRRDQPKGSGISNGIPT